MKEFPAQITAGKIGGFEPVLFQDTFRQIAAQTDLTAGDMELALIQSSQTAAEFAERTIDRTGNGSQCIFLRLAHIQNHRIGRMESG